jgi:uncharacterized OsmC-like protein/ketosteroid isomerase-like protein
MSAETVRVDWVRDQFFLLRDRVGYPIVMTQPGGVKGSDLLPLSVIGCAAWDLLSIIQKQRQQITGLELTAESIQEDEPPWRFLEIHIHYKIRGRDLKEERIQRAIDLSERNYCSTFATLRELVKITSDYEIVRDENSSTRTDFTADMAKEMPAWVSNALLVIRFNEALNARDVDAMMHLMTEDCLFENTYPAPDGMRCEGRQAVRLFWEDFFRSTREPRIEVEEIFESGDRCIMRWVYHWMDSQGKPGHIRGVDIYKVKDSLIAEKLSYVKG